MEHSPGNTATLMSLLIGHLLLLVLLSCGGCRASFPVTYTLESSSVALTPGSYSSSVTRSILQCAIRSSKLGAPGYGVRQSAQGVDCFVCTTDTLTTETPDSEDDYMTIFKLDVPDPVPHPSTERSVAGGGLDEAMDGTAVFVQYPFTSAGRVVKAQIHALQTTGTLLLGIYTQTSGAAGSCGSFQRVREVSITRTTTDTAWWEFGPDELRFNSGEYYGIVWHRVGGGIVPFSGGEELCFQEASDATVTSSSSLHRSYEINLYVIFQ